MRPWAALLSVSFVVSCLLVACGGSSDPESTGSTVPDTSSTLEALWRAPGDDVAIVPGTQTYETGPVRVSFLVVDSKGRPVNLPSAKVWLARALEAKPFLESTAKLERIGIPGESQADSTHIYVAHFALRKPGTYWLLAEPEGGSEQVQALGNLVVAAAGTAGPPEIGEPAPDSDTPTLRSAGGDTAELTTRVPPDVTLLEHSVAESLADHVPFVVTFATPKLCESRTCGPVVDVVEDVAGRSEGSGVRFIHVEVYAGNDPANGYNRWMQEWGLSTEPWTFVAGTDGRIKDRFEGPVSVRELEAAVDKVAAR